MKLFGALLAAALTTQGQAYINARVCAVADADKIDCGYLGINQSQCEDRDCCWQPLEEGSATPWCFKNSDMMSESECNYEDKLDCGYPGITKEQCEARQCCYEEVPGQPVCFGQ